MPRGPRLGLEFREEFLRSGKVEIDFVDEKTVDRSRVVWGRGESMSPKDWIDRTLEVSLLEM